MTKPKMLQISLTGKTLDELAEYAYMTMIKRYLELHPGYGGPNKELLVWGYQCNALKDDWTFMINRVLREAERLLGLSKAKPVRLASSKNFPDLSFLDGIPDTDPHEHN